VLVAKNSTQIGANGRVVIPAEIRRELGLRPGEEMLVQVEDGRVVLESRDNLLRRIQSEWQAAAEGRSMVDELLAERRREFEREERELEEWTKSRSSTRRR